MQETWVQSLGCEDPLKQEMATHFSILAWKIPWTGCRRAAVDGVTESWMRLSAHTHIHSCGSTCQVENPPAKQETWVDLWVKKIPWRRKQQPTSVFLPEKSHGQRSPVPYGSKGCKELSRSECLSTHAHARTRTHTNRGKRSVHWKQQNTVEWNWSRYTKMGRRLVLVDWKN